MPPPAPATALAPSLLDRLTDPATVGLGLLVGYTTEQMLAAVRRDLEDLLNTRCPYHDMPAEFPAVAKSVVAYGLPDMTSLPATDEADRDNLARVLEGVIARYEPRLKGVRVTLLQDADESQLQVKFQIEARLAVDPSPEVGFVTVLELFSGQASVQARTA